MANKYSKSNNSARAKGERTMKDYEERRKKLNTGARIMAILIIVTMIVFYVLSSGAALFN